MLSDSGAGSRWDPQGRAVYSLWTETPRRENSRIIKGGAWTPYFSFWKKSGDLPDHAGAERLLEAQRAGGSVRRCSTHRPLR